MTQEDISYIKQQTKILIGTKMAQAGRAAAMAWLRFTVDDREYALHLQCSFRFRKQGGLLIANLDMFEPTKSMEESPSFDWSTYDWDVQGFNCYDEWVARWKKEEHEAVVEAVAVSEWGDLTITFSDGLVLEVFCNAAQGECWRFFEHMAGSEHLVVTGQGLEA